MDRSVQTPATNGNGGAVLPNPDDETVKFLGIDLLIKKATAKKVIPLSLMFFGILFNYTILRDTKVRWLLPSDRPKLAVGSK